MIRLNLELIKEISQLVKNTCYSPENKFGTNAYDYHIQAVVAHAHSLAPLLNADEECCIIAAYLHDYASVLNIEYYPEYHIYGAKLAKSILEEKGYPGDKIELICRCIFNHRGSIDSERNTPEEVCIASADAMAHVTELPSLFYLNFCERKMALKNHANGLKTNWSKVGKSSVPKPKK